MQFHTEDEMKVELVEPVTETSFIFILGHRITYLHTMIHSLVAQVLSYHRKCLAHELLPASVLSRHASFLLSTVRYFLRHVFSLLPNSDQ